MRRFFSFAALLGLAAFVGGCSQEQQLENAQDELREEQTETAEAVQDAKADGVVTPEERSEVREEQGETAAAAGEVAEQAGEVIEKRADE